MSAGLQITGWPAHDSVISSILFGPDGTSICSLGIDGKCYAIFLGSQAQIRPQGEFESQHRDLIYAFGTWEFEPMDLENPFPNNEGSIQLWHGDEDRILPVTLQRYIVQRLPWIEYHELQGSGHMFPYADGMTDAMIKALLVGGK
ncbi:unnamed protein product [Camellia sinensis]